MLGVELIVMQGNREASYMLTTPRQVTPDSVFPEENWFFYWKTSPSLWKSKLENYQSTKPLIIPIYWGVHSQAPQVYDFGLNIPETDLSKIIHYAKDLGIRVIFGLGITPLPFLANGGLPSFLSKNLSLDKEKMGIATLDSSGTLNKMFSFYDPRVFQSYKKFLVDLKHNITKHDVEVDFIGLKAFYLDQGQCISFLNDNGLAYEQGFNRFVEQKMHVENKSINEIITCAQDEQNLKKEFENLIYDLYDESFKDLFGKYWLGSIDLCFLGASVEDLIERTHDLFESASHYVEDVFQIHSMNKVPCSVLIPHQQKSPVLNKSLSDVNNDQFYNNKLHYDFYEGEDVTSFESCTFFKLVNNFINEDLTLRKFKDLGLEEYIQKEFRWSYKMINSDFQINFDDINPSNIYFYFGKGINDKQFSKMVKIFLGGGKILLDKDQLNPELSKKLEMFFMENNLEIENVNYLCDIQHVKLDEEGIFVIYDG